MREILFRGKKYPNGNWIYGGYIHIKPYPIRSQIREKDLIIYKGFSDWGMPCNIDYCEVIPETVGQYTGVKDIDGTRIFENDIFAVNDSEFGDIYYKVVWEYDRWILSPNYGVASDMELDWASTQKIFSNAYDLKKRDQQ